VRGRTVNGGVNISLDRSRCEGAGLTSRRPTAVFTWNLPASYNAEPHTETTNGSIDVDFPTAPGELHADCTQLLPACLLEITRLDEDEPAHIEMPAQSGQNLIGGQGRRTRRQTCQSLDNRRKGARRQVERPAALDPARERTSAAPTRRVASPILTRSTNRPSVQ
jgi:hypothetical protein